MQSGEKEKAMNDFDVVCIGVVLMDLPLGPLDEQIFHKETTMVPGIRLTTGGDAFNEAVILARLGKKPALLGQIGADLLGDLVVKRCEEEGVDYSFLRRDSDTDTRINVVVIGKDGQRHFIKTQSRGSSGFHPGEIDYSFTGRAKAVSLASIFCSKLKDPAFVYETLKAAREQGLITFADMVPMTDGETISSIEKSLPYLDYFMPNAEEAELLTGLREPDDMADFLLDYGVKNVIVKLGREGCLIKNKKVRLLIPAFPADAVDTTGAGDNFAAGFITAVMDGMDLKYCGNFANAVAAASTESVGAVGGVKNIKQIQEYLKTRLD